jgi:ribose transport system substrate-binding protein
MQFTKPATIAAGAVMVLGLAGCQNSAASSAKGVKIGLSVSTLNNPYFVQLRQGAEAEAKKEGVKITTTDAQNDASQQVNQVQNFISQSMKAIIINPVDSAAAAPAVKAADRGKIPVIAADRGVTGATVAQTVASDNVTGGKLAAQQLGKALGGKGKVVVLQGTPGTSAANDRQKGFTEGITAFPGIQVVAQQPADFDRTQGLNVMTNLLQAHSDLGGVFAANDEMALGAIKALGAKAGRQVKVVGFDGTPDGLKAVQTGAISADVAQQPVLLGRLAVQAAVQAAKSGKIQQNVAVPVKVATKENLSQFMSGS